MHGLKKIYIFKNLKFKKLRKYTQNKKIAPSNGQFRFKWVKLCSGYFPKEYFRL